MKPSTIAAINIETGRAHVKHGQSFERGSDFFRSTVMGEEKGEVDKAVLELAAAVVRCDDEAIHAARDHLRAEIAQVASLAARWLDAMGGDNG